MISVCIATYNGEKYIEEQLESILKQIGESDEVVISDDASVDNTCAIIEAFNDKRIKLLHNNSKSCKWNFQNALSNAHGDIIFMSDQDDVWLEGKVDRCVEELKHYDLVVTNSKETDQQLNIVNPDFFSVYNSGTGLIKNAINNTYYGSCMAFKADILKYALPFPPTNEIGHDIWIGLVAEMVGKVKFINEPYLLYRRHEQTVTSTNRSLMKRSNRSFLTKVFSRLVVFYYIIKFKINH